MRKRTKIVATAVLAVILVLAVAMGVSATTGTKNISALFRNIHIVANDKVVTTDTEPFIVNGRTFVPLRAVSEALGAWVDWNEATSMVTIKGGTNSAEMDILKAQIAAKDVEIANLKKQLEEKKEGNLTDLAKEITRDYDELGDVEIDKIALSGNKDSVTVNIDVDLDDFDREWEDLSDSEIKSWLTKVVADVQDYYSGSTYVSGRIRDIDSRYNLVTFSKDGSRSLSITYRDDDYRGSSSSSSGKNSDLEEQLMDDFVRLRGEKGTVRVDEFLVSGSKSKVTLEIEVDLYSYEGPWAKLSDSEIEDWLEDICEEIQDFYNDDTQIVGEIIDVYSDDTLVDFSKKGTSRLKVTFEDYEYR